MIKTIGEQILYQFFRANLHSFLVNLTNSQLCTNFFGVIKWTRFHKERNIYTHFEFKDLEDLRPQQLTLPLKGLPIVKFILEPSH
jgi:hypothetical protein